MIDDDRQTDRIVYLFICSFQDKVDVVMMSPKANQLDETTTTTTTTTTEVNSNGKGSNGLLSTFNRKRRHVFDVNLKVERVLSLPYASGKFFFKIRLLNGGNHVYTCHQCVFFFFFFFQNKKQMFFFCLDDLKSMKIKLNLIRVIVFQ